MVAAVRAAAPRWTAVESHWLVPCGLAAAVAAPGLPHHARAHSGDVALLERLPLGAEVGRHIGASTTRLIFASEDLRRRFVARCGAGHGRLRVAPCDVDRACFAARTAVERRRARERRGVRAPLLISVGRLVPIKGFDLLLGAVARLPQDSRPLVVLAGEGPQRAALAARAARLGVELRFLGEISRPDVSAWLGAADVYAQPSRTLATGRTEGMPLAAREALAVGLPVIASSSGGLRELDGVVQVPHGDVGALAGALKLALARASSYA
jgi:glycosyltransferase involved in cell wall biosynthesis